MRMHGQELSVAARYEIPIIILVANNSGYGSISNRLANSKVAGYLSDLERVDWVEFGRLFGASGCHVDRPEQMAEALRLGLKYQGPFVIDLNLPRVAAQGLGTRALWPE